MSPLYKYVVKCLHSTEQIYQLPVYPGTATALKHMKSAFGVELTSLKDVTVEKVEQLIKPNTKVQAHTQTHTNKAHTPPS